MAQKWTELLYNSCQIPSESHTHITRAFQLRLIRIIYKRDLYDDSLNLQKLIYEHKEKFIEAQKALSNWQKANKYMRKVNGDHSMISKVRQNKAFEMRRKMNVDQYKVQQRSNSESQTKYEHLEQESKLSYIVARDIKNKLLLKC